ncbi:hypothetical protein F0U60_44995 [Archangium minus]|uniref:Uncharacterized protein n=1 Tax=Archangium minus TaxID=83450 RepID=A0ABY9X532_9BACT|nr:hypothetical protein F0U60_44995 [Archangium minus]
MANEMKRGKSVRVQQALHGYSDGHRLLACSAAELKPRDAKTMLVLSDASGPGATIDEAGYLTGYPLAESGLYAIARTWAAPEMTRPGCVWTHTLLIDFADLALIPTMDALTHVFSRPSDSAALSEYNAILTLNLDVGEPVSSPSHFLEKYRSELQHLLLALYGRPKSRVVASIGSQYDREKIATALWSQQWPRLRRAFRFCTLAFSDRSLEGAPFDLQFIPTNDRAARSRFSALVDAERLSLDSAEWLDAALEDLAEGSTGRLRAFLRQAGGDVPGGREAFEPLCRLHHLVNEIPRRPAAIEDAVLELDQSFGTELARGVRALVATSAAQHADTLGERGLTFILQHLDLLDAYTFEEQAEQIGLTLWSRNPSEICRLLAAQPPQRTVAERTLTALSTRNLADGVRRNPSTAIDILTRRPDVATETIFWAPSDTWQSKALEIVAQDSTHVDSAIHAMLASTNTNLAPLATRAFGPSRVFSSVVAWLDDKREEEPKGSDAAWLIASLVDRGVIARTLSQKAVRTNTTLVAIARATHPDFVPNDYGRDPWWTATAAAEGDLSEQGRQYLSAYILSRALGDCSHNPDELMTATFDAVYFAALQSRLSEEAWRLLEPRLPWASWWFGWDHCQRLREGVVDAFVDRTFSPLMFGEITRDDDLFIQLTELAARNGRGRSFLRDVKRAMKETDQYRFRYRIRAIEDAL